MPAVNDTIDIIAAIDSTMRMTDLLVETRNGICHSPRRMATIAHATRACRRTLTHFLLKHAEHTFRPAAAPARPHVATGAVMASSSQTHGRCQEYAVMSGA
jgi:hypothetical protein